MWHCLPSRFLAMPAIGCCAICARNCSLGKQVTHDLFGPPPFGPPHCQGGGGTVKSLRALIPIAIVLAAWEAAAKSGLWSRIVFPSLESIGKEFWLFVARAEAWEQIWTSLYRA